jgi:hypothetical protein
MAKKASTKTAVSRTAARPKPKVMQAALLMWAHRIYHSADEAVKKAGGYASYHQNPKKFKTYAEVFKLIRALADKLDAMAGRPVAPTAYVKGGCEDDQDCPDDQICVHGRCEPSFPQD